MSSSLDLSKWFSERPMWLQLAAQKLLKSSDLTSTEISELAAICKLEANSEPSKSTYSFPSSAFLQCAAGSLRLSSISAIEGVNALSPKQPLEFGKGNISVVYGNNGSGKSSYIRLLKHVCGAMEMGTLHNNVYSADTITQKACITFEQNGIIKKHDWSGQGICEELSSVDIFDTSFGKFFVSSEDEVSYEPPVLAFFSSLISVSEKVSSNLDVKANQHLSKKPNMPMDKKTTPEGIWYESISAKTTQQDIDINSLFSTPEESEIQALQQRLSEQAPAEKAKQLRNKKQHVDSLIKDVRKFIEQLSDQNCQNIITAKKVSILKNSAAVTAAEKVFSDSKLEGIGTDVWKELWESARLFSVSLSYIGVEYPNTSEGSRCVLCHQTLTEDAKGKLTAFESFVKGQMQKAATDANKEYETASQAIGVLPTTEALKVRVDAAGISNNVISSKITDFFTLLQDRKDQVTGINAEETIIAPLLSPDWIEAVNAYSTNYSEQAKKYETDAQNDNSGAIRKSLASLESKKWLSENRTAIDEEVIRLKLLGEIEKAKKLTNTRAISSKKGELAEALITDAFVQRFNDELKVLGASKVKVDLVKTKVVKGRVLHKLKLRGASQSGLVDILSEGENRIVSIAAFLADVTGKSNPAPFIFDDPISSLDQSYEEAVVQRLIELSQDKQVIVFTHRLSLLGTVKQLSEKKGMKTDVISIRSADWGAGEPASIPLSQSDIKTALNRLIDQRHQSAKKSSESGDFETAEILIKSICSDFRILLERSIENDLLCGVIQRFQRPVSTLKLKDLAKLKGTDCMLIDSLMTKFSTFEHSQPDESPVNLPSPDELLQDMNKLKSWREEYIKRSA